MECRSLAALHFVFSFGIKQKNVIFAFCKCCVLWFHALKLFRTKNMKKILLVIFAFMAFALSAEAQMGVAKLSMNKKHACMGERIQFSDLTPRTENVTGRQWAVGDSIVFGDGIGESITVYRAFETDSNIIELYVFLATPDTIVGPENDTTFSVYYDTLYAYDTLFVFIPEPILTSGDSVACVGDYADIKIDNTKEGISYRWYESKARDAEEVVFGSALRVKPYAAEALYYVKMADAYGCYAWDSTMLYILDNTLNTMPSDGVICEGDEAVLMAGKADHYKWESVPADTTLDSLYNQRYITVSPTKKTVYAVTPYGSNGCEGERVIATITVQQKPTLDISYSPTIIDPDDPILTFTNSTPRSEHSFWTFGRRETAEGSSVEHIFLNLYNDSAIVSLRNTDDLGCQTDSTFKIPVQRFTPWFPTAFTPNRSENSTFSMRCISAVDHFSINIYNREGLLVFESEDPNFVWDGSHNGTDCPQGVYVYICRSRRINSTNLENNTGTVLLLR